MAKKKIYQFPPMTAEPADDDLLLMWDTSEGKTKALPASLLPSGGGGGGGGGIETDLGSPFAVRNTDPNYYPNEETGDSTVTDPRLLGKEDYAVTTTQLGGQEFADDQITYDKDAGSFTLRGFQLDNNQKLRVYADGIITSQANTLLSKIELLLQVAAPFLPTVTGPNAGKVWYTGDLAALAGTGWQECVAMRGLLPVGIDPGDDDFNVAPGTILGSKTLKITNTNQLPKFRLFTVVAQTLSSVQHPSTIGRAVSNIRSFILSYLKTSSGGPESYELCGSDADNVEPTISPTSYIGKADPDAIKNIPHARAGTWIEFVGLA